MTLLVTRRLLTLAGAMAIAGAVALAERSWVLAAVLVPLACAATLGLLEVTRPLPRRGHRELDRSALLKHDTATVHVHVDAVPLPVGLCVTEVLPDGWEAEPGSCGPFQPGPRGLSTTYRVRTHRHGAWTLGDLEVERVGLLGIARRSAMVPQATHVTVLPTSAAQRGMRVRPRPPDRTGLSARAARSGPGDEFYALREYVPGDEVGRINWRATARHQRPITNEVLPEEPSRYVLYVDARSPAAERTRDADAFERTLEAAATLADALIAARAHVGLVLVAWESRVQAPAGGAAQAGRLRQMLLECRPGEDGPVDHLLESSVHMLPSRACAILVSSNLYDPTLPAALGRLRSRHRFVSLLVPAFPEPPGELAAVVRDRAAGTLLNADQHALVAQIRHHADSVAQWLPGEPIGLVWARLGLAGRAR